ncbi:ATP-binding protein [uncultured Arthrobacter sp.]|uniref:sensor histidine kinase n=1 Tax=uncultured Arthrobacter sp. TaxID=114050 RepID=UPI0025F4BED2|nr:ATP-binding protein [uncultured Arthrobacter sp.]
MSKQDVSWAGFGGTAVVASPSDEDGQDLCAILQQAGYAAVPVSSGSALLGTLRQSTPDIVFLDLQLADESSRALLGVLESDSRFAGLPIILLLPDSAPLEPGGLLENPITDFVFRPYQEREIIQRAASAIARRRQHRVQRESASLLRERMREISAGIRATNSLETMVGNFLAGLGRALGSDSVFLQIFPDDRVADLSSHWSSADADPMEVPSLAHSGRAKALALRLWESSTGERFPPAEESASAGTSVFEDLEDLSGITSGVVVALGEGTTPFGLVWLINNHRPLEWTPVENSLTQHVLGNFAHGLIQGQLIARQQQAVEKLRRLNKAKSDFVGTVNHELRTPLASMAGYLEMILDGSGGPLPEGARRMLETVERNTTRLRDLIENITALSPTLDEPHGHLSVDLGHVVAAAAGDLSAAAAAKNVALRCPPSEESILIAGHYDQLKEAVALVISNAVKFTGPGGVVEVHTVCRSAAGPAEVVVRDTGIGIPEADIPRLFESFFRASNATDGAVPGAGVGLAIAQRTVSAHNGAITVDSAVGEGTTVRIEMPLKAASPVASRS